MTPAPGLEALALAKAREAAYEARHGLKGHDLLWDGIAAAAVTAYLAALPTSRVEAPVAWQWSDFSGKWYTVDTSRTSLPDQEALARKVAADHEGRVRALYPASALEAATAARVRVEQDRDEANQKAEAWERLADEVRRAHADARDEIDAIKFRPAASVVRLVTEPEVHAAAQLLFGRAEWATGMPLSFATTVLFGLRKVLERDREALKDNRHV